MTPASEDSSPTTSTTEEKTKSSTEQHGLNFHFSALNSIPPWAKFVLGSAVLFAIPLLSRVVKSQGLKKTAEAAVKAADELVEAADKVVEAAEKLAEAAEKVLEEVVEALPSGGLKDAAMKLEEIAAYVEKRAEFADSLLDSSSPPPQRPPPPLLSNPPATGFSSKPLICGALKKSLVAPSSHPHTSSSYNGTSTGGAATAASTTEQISMEANAAAKIFCDSFLQAFTDLSIDSMEL